MNFVGRGPVTSRRSSAGPGPRWRGPTRGWAAPGGPRRGRRPSGGAGRGWPCRAWSSGGSRARARWVWLLLLAGKILLPGARAAAARGCRRVRCVGYTAPHRRGGCLVRRGPRQRAYILGSAMPASCFAGLSEGYAPKNVARARGGRACQLRGTAAAPAARAVAAHGTPTARSPMGFDGIGAATRAPSTSPATDTGDDARRRRAPPRPVETDDDPERSPRGAQRPRYR